MKINVNVPLCVTGFTKRGARKEVVGTVPLSIEIPEYSSGEVPLALSFKTHVNSEGETKSYTHEYYGLEDDLLKKTIYPASFKSDADCIFRQYPQDNNTHIYHEYPMRQARERLRKQENREAKWYSKNVFPKELGEYLDDFSDRGFKLSPLSELSISDYWDDVRDEQIEKYMKHIGSLVSVDGQIFQKVQEPVISISRFFSSDEFSVKLCRVRVSRNRPSQTIKSARNGLWEVSSLVSFKDFGKISDFIERDRDANNPNQNVKYGIGDVNIYDPKPLKANSALLTSLNFALEMLENFNAYCRRKLPYEVRGDKLSEGIYFILMNLTTEELSIFQNLMSAVKSANISEISTGFEDAIFDVERLYQKNNGKGNFGNLELIEKAVSTISDAEIAISAATSETSPTLFLG